jgi:hypothetical protein
VPSQTSVEEITVTNRSGKTLDVSFTTVDFEGSVDPEDSHILVEDGSSPWGAQFWLETELDEITLDHGDTLTFDVKISVPLDAEPGGHFAAVLVESEESDLPEDTGGARVQARLTSLFLITVPGDIDARGNINDPDVPLIADFGPVSIRLVFNNLGNVHQSPSGTVTVTNLLGQQVAEIPVQEWIVLPDSSRSTTVDWPGKWHLGPYKVRAQIAYGDDGETLYSTSTIWFIPWKIILAALAASFIILFLITLYTRRRRRKRQEVQEELEELRTLKEEGMVDADEEEVYEEAAAEETAGETVEDTGGQQTTRPYMSKDLVPLNELLPSLEDSNIVDISDPETKQLVRELINNEMDLARMFIVAGQNEEAREELFEARAAALRLQLLSEVAMIDDLLNYL